MAVIADTKREAYVNTSFIYAGRKFQRGDVFPHAELKLTPFDLGGLVRVGYVRLSPPSVAPAALPAATAQATEAAAAPGPAANADSERVAFKMQPGETVTLPPADPPKPGAPKHGRRR